jgi:hypothetical protein
MGTVWLQHDGAPAHFVLIVSDTLNEHLSSHWNDCGSPTFPTLILPCQTTLYEALKRNKWLGTILFVSKAVEQVFAAIMTYVI